MTITHSFRSGNGCDIHIPKKVKRGKFNSVSVEWDSYPPSAADLREYEQEVYPGRVMPVLEGLVRQSHGPGQAVEIAPGVRGWVQSSSDKEKNQ
jgi:hypothetical protein